ncbi:MAG: 1-acyl-sn-glycerol-3-phosphate acyltransferase [Planctomycetia bacterium]|nr:MAG: 1-acyl-sn-glycerol-3-phosphate acyltransferase [Planctomycetia bacterium]
MSAGVETSAAPAAAAQAPRLAYSFCRMVCRLVVHTFFRARVHHANRVPASGPVLLVCNHQSYVDPVLAGQGLWRECHFMARDTLFRGYFERLIRFLNAFPVKRGTADIAAVKETLRRLRSGALVTVFPEATRSTDGSIAPMQAGVVLLARKTGAPLVPCMIDGAFEAWPRHAKLPRPRRIVIAYGEPMHVATNAQESDDAFIERVRLEIIALMDRYGKRRAHPPQRSGAEPHGSSPAPTSA